MRCGACHRMLVLPCCMCAGIRCVYVGREAREGGQLDEGQLANLGAVSAHWVLTPHEVSRWIYIYIYLYFVPSGVPIGPFLFLPKPSVHLQPVTVQPFSLSLSLSPRVAKERRTLTSSSRAPSPSSLLRTSWSSPTSTRPILPISPSSTRSLSTRRWETAYEEGTWARTLPAHRRRQHVRPPPV